MRDRFSRTYTGTQPEQACLYWAQAAVDVLTRHGVRALIQAGSCSWPRLSLAQDDGVSPTHLSYVWEPDSITTRFQIGMGGMPEMHVWAAVPHTGEIVDLTTGFWPANCRRVLGTDWPGAKPPDYFWGTADELPPRVLYKPDKLAIGWALRALDDDAGALLVKFTPGLNYPGGSQ